ncbi:MAG: hypothetical protein ACUVTZ_13520 [Armatimonadota bacterium]
MLVRRTAICAFILLVFATTVFAAQPDTDAVLLRYNLREGDVFPYRLTIDMTGKGSATEAGNLDMSASLQLVLRMAVQKVNPDLTYQMQVQVINPKVIANGQEVPVTTGQVPPIVITMTKTGAVKSIQGLEGLAGGAAVPGLDPTSFSNIISSLTVFPEKPLKPNDTWTYTVPVTFFGSAKANATAKCKLVGFETSKDGVRLAKVSTSLTVPMDMSIPPPANTVVKGQQTGQITTRYSCQSGMPYDANGTTNMKMKMTIPPPMGPDGKPVGKPTDIDMDLKMQVKIALAPELKQEKPAEAQAQPAPPPPPQSPQG